MNHQLYRVLESRRAAKVGRYHQHDLLRPENIAHHSFNMLNMILVITDYAASAELLKAVVTHDIGEIYTGDIPGNVKKILPLEARKALQQKDDEAVWSIHPTAAHVNHELSPEEAFLLKLVDCLDGILKVSEEMRLGNREVCFIGEAYVGFVHELMDQCKPGAARDMAAHVIQYFRDSY